ncbi:MAG: hypothetical protein HC804_02050 [Anaerolineae bacterium]|nr:hypothetical protein [Anaerolineae bacterium]
MPLDKEVRPYLRLLGFQRGDREAFTGQPYGLALWWLATRAIAPTTTQFVLIDSSGNETIVSESQPVYDTYPLRNGSRPNSSSIPNFLLSLLI